MPRIVFGSTGIYMDNSASWGRWAEDGVATGTHKDFQTEISHTPLPLWKQANIRFFAGYRKDLYSTNDAIVRDPYTGVVLNQGINAKLWTTLWYTKHNLSGTSPYRFDTIDHPRQKGVSIGYKLTPLDTFILTFDKDLDTDQVADRDFTCRGSHIFIGVSRDLRTGPAYFLAAEYLDGHLYDRNRFTADAASDTTGCGTVYGNSLRRLWLDRTYGTGAVYQKGVS